MNRQDIVAMAIQADLVPDNLWETPELERFAALVAAAEREACADICWQMAKRAGGDIRTAALEVAVERIRARGQQ